MARRFNMVVVAVIALVALLQSSEAQTVHVVGGTAGWIIPSGGASVYTTWAASQTFTVGDILVFNFSTGAHDVAEVTKAAYDSCSSTSPISIANTGPANVTLDAAGEHYFICTFSGHCSVGQKLAINVSSAASKSPAPQPSSSTSPSPSPAASAPTPEASVSSPTTSPASAPTPTPSRAPVVYQVGDSLGWTIPTSTFNYSSWAASKSFIVGDTLVFNFTTGAHDVAEVAKAAYDSCNITTTISKITTGPARITLTTAGEHYYVCTFPGHCSIGQKLAIRVTSTSSTATSPSSTTPSSPSPAGSATPPSPANSATSFGTAGVLSTFLSIAVALLY